MSTSEDVDAINALLIPIPAPEDDGKYLPPWGLSTDDIFRDTDWVCTGDGMGCNSEYARRRRAERDLIDLYHRGDANWGGTFVREVTTAPDPHGCFYDRIRHELVIDIPPLCATQYVASIKEWRYWEMCSYQEKAEINKVLYPPRPRDLYRYYSARGELLYVGQSFSAFARASGHRKRATGTSGSGWWSEVKRMEREEIPEDLINEAEVVAIKTERPKYNVTHAIRGNATWQTE